MKIMTVAGTRPELIRLSRIIPTLDEVSDHHFLWTGQNYDPRLSDVFFEELGVRAPDTRLFTSKDAFNGPMDWVGSMLSSMENQFRRCATDRLLVLGDTNSALSAFVAKRMGIPVYHMEAGNRCYDDRVPEEVNRRVIDSCSDVLLPYTNRSRDNLLAEGYPARRIYVTGNPIYEVLCHYKDRRRETGILDELGVGHGGYLLATVHRAENVDDKHRLKYILDSLQTVQRDFDMPLLVSTHPRTKDRLKDFGLDWDQPTGRVEWKGIQWLDPLGFHDFVRLEESAHCVLSDSGTVQEECCILNTPAVTLRDTTERPETVDCGSNIVSGLKPDRVLEAARAATKSSEGACWSSPEGYTDKSVSWRVAKILMGELPC